MIRNHSAIAAIILAVSTPCVASSSYIVPTTTLAAQISNNTSAANTFTSLSNGDRGAGNVSKVDMHTLLYSGATTKIYAHMVLWFGDSNHMNIGYSSSNPEQVKNQIDDMVSRGIDGVILDWYGPNNSMDKAAQLIMAQAENHPGFTFAIMVDQGAIQWYSCSGCSPQQAFVSELQYIEHTYFPSPAYMTIAGRPVVTNFNVGLSYPSVDWNAAAATLSTRPLFIFQNNNGFSQPLSDGSYAWVMPTTTDYGMHYLSSFYDQGMSFPNEQTMGAIYKGFNDTKASWGSDRIMKQQCGQTWLQTFAEVNGLYSAGKQLPDLQIVTWNDYEEATEIESGIDNCFALEPSLSGNALQWTISGDENTVDHYTVYVSADGENLMSLTDIATGLHSLNLCGFSIPEGDYKLFVQAVGKPTLANQITGAISYSPTCPATAAPPTPPTPPTPPPVSVLFGALPTSVKVVAGKSGSVTVKATAQSGASNNPISLSCRALPSSLRCSFSPVSITPGAGTATSTLTISAVTVMARNLPKKRRSIPIYGSWLFSFGIVGFCFAGKGHGRRRLQMLALVGIVSIGMVSASCGGGDGPQAAATTTSPGAPAAPQSYVVTINGSSSSSQFSTNITVIVQ
jgi:hypothetical protein